MEIWKEIKGYEGYYEVSSEGRVRSCDRVVAFGKQKRLSKGRILVINTAGSNYNHIKLSKNNNIKRFYIHRLVAEAFVENKYNKPEIDHINGNARDNRACNLRWVTRIENCNNLNTKYNEGQFKKGNKPYNYIPFDKKIEKPMQRYVFKKLCEKENKNFYDFEEVFNGVCKKEKVYTYIYKNHFKGYKEEK